MTMKLTHESTDPAHVPQDEPPRCAACGSAELREFLRLGSLYDRVVWMDQHVPSASGAPPPEELVAIIGGTTIHR